MPPVQASVIIPTRDRLSLLRRSVRAASCQTDVAVEVIVVDDGSTDGTWDWLQSGAPGDIRPLRHERARGLARARNTGIAVARGHWVAFLDDDDVWSPTKLRDQIAAAARSDARWAFAGVVQVDEQLRPQQLMPLPEPSALPDRILAAQVVPAGSSNVVVERALLWDVGGFDERLAHIADWDLWIRLAGRAPVGATEEVLVGYVHHGSNMHVSPDLDGAFAELDYLERKHEQARRSRGIEIDRAAFVRWAAWGHRRAGRPWRAALVHGREAAVSPVHLRHALRALLGTRPLRWWRVQRPPDPGWLASYR